MRRAGLAVTAALAISAATAAAAVAPAPGTFTGKTAQGRGTKLVVSDSHRVKLVEIHWRAPCDPPAGGWIDRTQFIDRSAHPIVQSGGNFSDDRKYTKTDAAGYTGHIKAHVQGHFPSAGHADGQFSIDVRVYRNGVFKGHCFANTPWHANRQP